jgi:hypothetical protein
MALTLKPAVLLHVSTGFKRCGPSGARPRQRHLHTSRQVQEDDASCETRLGHCHTKGPHRLRCATRSLRILDVKRSVRRLPQ